MVLKIDMKKDSPVFWADQIADKAIKRAKREGNIVTCRSAASPSGGKHIGNLFDVIKSHIVHRSVEKNGFDSRFLITNDDRDPLRKIPDKLPGLDAKWMEVDDDFRKEYKQYLGLPYTEIPDPFGCCESWAEHFGTVWVNGIKAMNIDLQVYSNDELYKQGKYIPYIKKILENIQKSREVISSFQKTKTMDYIPFTPICENCGKIIGEAVNFDLENETIDYVCKGQTLAGKYEIKGCGHKGTVSFMDGKLPWSFEWPANWSIFNTTYEPFGKEHAEGSWPRGKAIMKKIYKEEPPIPHIYEFLLVNGEKMSASKGNVYIAQEILDILEPEIFYYFYTKKSKKQRNLDLKNIHRLVDEFEKSERVYFGKKEVGNEKQKENMIRMYESCFKKVPEKMPLRVPYQFAGIIASMYPKESTKKAVELLKSTGHIQSDKLSDKQLKQVEKRLWRAKTWVERFAPEQKITVNENPPKDLDLNDDLKNIIKELKDVLSKDVTEEELNSTFFDLCRENDVKPKQFFKTMYKIIFSKDHGPRLAPFILTIGKDKVRELLERV